MRDGILQALVLIEILRSRLLSQFETEAVRV
jgi:hypothetical protein